MSTTTKQSGLGVNVVGAALIVIVSVLITLACLALVTAQADAPGVVRPQVASVDVAGDAA